MKSEKTQRIKEHIIDESFKLFASKNYEQVVVPDIEVATGLTRGSIFYHIRNKEDLFIQVIDKYIVDKFFLFIKRKMRIQKATTLKGFLASYIRSIEKEIDFMHSLSITNVYKSYFFLIMQAPLHYPHFEEKMQGLINISDRVWERIIRQAIINGEIKEDTNIQYTIIRFRNCFMGMGLMKCLTVEELDINELTKHYSTTYNSLKKEA